MIRGALIGIAVMLGSFAFVGLLVGIVWLGLTLWGPIGPAFIIVPLLVAAAGVLGALSTR